MKDISKELLKELVRLDIQHEDIETAKNVIEACPDAAATLENPLITSDEKRNIVRKIFPQSLERFIINAAKSGIISELDEIFSDYEEILMEKQGSIKAVVRYVTPLTETQQADLRKFIMEKFIRDDVDIEYKHDPDIIGGFILNAGDVEYDRSYRTSLREIHETLQNRASEAAEKISGDIKSGDIISILKTEVKDFEVRTGATETGFIIRLGDGIARVHGMSSVMYGELVEFETGVRGIVQNLEEKSVGVVLLGDDYGLTEGSSVVR
ncbi:MAG: ATP synthase F1 subunit delta, partial [Ruminococcus sp.]|nr:ATP synthase F1 subunit delta [Ruminococcus sp.]